MAGAPPIVLVEFVRVTPGVKFESTIEIGPVTGLLVLFNTVRLPL
jgi:hypothetical protein